MARKKITVQGIVQGVGFRPFIYNLAVADHLTGFVANTPQGVIIEVEGTIKRIDIFIDNIKLKAPPLSLITDISFKTIKPINSDSFIIKDSTGNKSITTLISPDIAVCQDCLKELFDPNDRRFHYPFINCTNCGPRYTIIDNIPYDRPYTSMKHFNMCTDCQSEYDDPTNRRFHAQPNACAKCGPQVQLFDSKQNIQDVEDPIGVTRKKLVEGKIVAIKGLGGFHLAAGAINDDIVQKLRKLKGRDEKPFALMVRDIKIAHRYCSISNDEEQVLQSFAAPILLLKKLTTCHIAESVAPGNDYLGIMLPYTPLHHVLFEDLDIPLIMTSANYSEEPICIDNNEAFERLKDVADYFLIHNRDIYLRSDDSVAIHLANKLRYLRRSRGIVPQPIFVKSTGSPVLAVGGELKNTVCLLKDDKAIVSQHIGDLENIEAYNFFKLTIEHLKRIFDAKPELIIHDLHPQYFSTQWTKEQSDIQTIAVQHHHAHLAACMAENQLIEPVIGIIMDGTGYGTDGTIWGGEILIGDYNNFDRFAHFEQMPLPGGDAAIKSPWRTAVSYLHNTFDSSIPTLPFLENHNIKLITEIVDKNINSPLTSSCGRLFDAVAAMSGGRQTIRYEAQAAIELMQAFETINVRPFSFMIEQKNDHREILLQPIVRSLVRSIQNNESISKISSRFHNTLVQIYLEIAKDAHNETGINQVVLSGGVFQNMVLFEHTILALEKANFKVYTHSQVPTNDGGISLGQAMIGRANFN
ncbi:MAG: carbamoyltransferase HypF [Planctomycetia bacterium]|nr:carbamoyltransferase HypF [Planctomycetia bacterium]